MSMRMGKIKKNSDTAKCWQDANWAIHNMPFLRAF